MKLAVLPKGLLASASYMVIRLWDTHTGKTVRILTGHTDWVYFILSLFLKMAIFPVDPLIKPYACGT